ncbi:MAG: type I methionyl aminopeptidase [Phycisphaerales bacterium JB050]
MLNPHWSGPPILLKSSEEVERCRAAGAIVIEALHAARTLCVAGMTTREIDRVISNVLAKHGATGLFRGYRQTDTPPFPAEACISVNDEVVHGIPGERVLQPCDLVSVDVGVRFEGYCGDSAVSFLVPPPKDATEEQRGIYLERAALIADTRELLDRAIAMIQPGRRWSEIGSWMQQTTMDLERDLVTEFVGHGIGRSLHEPPKVPCYWDGFVGQDFVLEPGMILAIEPMLVIRDPSGWPPAPVVTGSGLPHPRAGVHTAPDGWTIRTDSGAVACHEEYMVLIGESGPEVLTLGTPRTDYLALAGGGSSGASECGSHEIFSSPTPGDAARDQRF